MEVDDANSINGGGDAIISNADVDVDADADANVDVDEHLITETTNPTKKKILLDDNDEEEEEDEDMEIDEPEEPKTEQVTPTTTTTTATSSSPTTLSNRLISQIINPSPFQHHNENLTSDRYRSALQRINISPLNDVEAWEAIMTECMSLYRTQLLPAMKEERSIFSTNQHNYQYSNELVKKLDWVESCHGHILHYFPYTASYYVSMLEVLYAKSALPFESLTTNGEDDYTFLNNMNNRSGDSVSNFIRSSLNSNAYIMIAEKKMEYIFEFVLGVKMDGSPTITTSTDAAAAEENDENNIPEDNTNDILGGMCTSSVELWLLYIHKRSRDAKRYALQHHIIENNGQNTSGGGTKITSQGEDLIRNWIIGAYETALSNGASFVYNNDIIWKQYLKYVKSWNIMTTSTTSINNTSMSTTNPMPEVTINHMLHSKQKELLRSIYQRIVTLPMTGLDNLWMEYESYEKAQSEQLASALIAEYMPKYQHARSVYLERNRVYNIHELRMGKVATPPADYRSHGQSSSSITGTVGGSTNAASSGANKTFTEEEIKSEIIEEMVLLSKWKKRCSYERTNPERLSNSDLTMRIRQCFKDTVCAFMRHVEVWHEWSMWELYNTGSKASTAATTNAVAGSAALGNGMKRNVQYAIAVLNLAQTYIPDCTLLAYSNATIVENQGNGKNDEDNGAIEVMTQFCNRSGNTLGYVLLQRLVRKYRGVKEAREVFATARRALRVKVEDTSDGGMSISGGKGDGVTAAKQGDQGLDNGAKLEGGTGNAGVVGQDASVMNLNGTNESKKRLVMTRETFGAEEKSNNVTSKSKKYTEGSESNKNRFITWHLYASHAMIEHRINKLPQVAARVYELGLKKHRTFLATPQYVLQYCSLLFELGDEENLRALLTRAIAACEEESDGVCDDAAGVGANASKINLLKKREKQRPLWDMMLMFESIVSSRSGDQSAFRDIEEKRRHALFGPENEDVSGGSFLNESEVGIGMQKISLNDTLIRADGYDVSSKILNGLDRIVDTLEISGVLGQESEASLSSLGVVWKDDGAGGLSDSSFRRRKRLQAERSIIRDLSITGSDLLRNTPLDSGIATSTTGKLLSAKERLAQSALQSQNMNAAAAILSSPEWLRGILSLLPATTRFRGIKAPPHMIEMTLQALRSNVLPASRPSDSLTPTVAPVKRKRKANDDDSSDEENGKMRGSGYGNQFKARQRAKLLSSNLGSSQLE